MDNRKFRSTMLSLVVTLIVLFTFGGITVLADEKDGDEPQIVASGYCGAEGDGGSVPWKLDSAGLLTISGTGDMKDFTNDSVPWKNNRNDINEVRISQGVTSIGNFAFYSCSNITSITIPNSVTSIGDGAFVFCPKLASVTIPNSVTRIGLCAFMYCSKLTSITLPNSITCIDLATFSGCTSLTSIYIPNNVTRIGEDAFQNCSNLASINIPKSVTRIDGNAFESCNNLTALILNAKPDVLGNNPGNIFPSSITANIYVPITYASDYDSLFSSFGNVTLYDLDGNAVVIARGNCGFEANGENVSWKLNIAGLLTINGTGKMKDFTYDSVPWKNNRNDINEVRISQGVTSIGDSAFYNCSKLDLINIPNSVTSIGNDTFYGCSSLALTSIPDGVTNIGDRAFYNCSQLSSITISDKVTNIGKNAFSGCENITKLQLEVDPSIFIYDLSNIFSSSIKADVYVPYTYASDYGTLFSSFENIHLYYLDGNSIIVAIGHCGAEGNEESVSWKLDSTGLLTISGTGKMGDFAYDSVPWKNNRKYIKVVDIVSGVTSIGVNAFSGCSSLASITIPGSVTSVGDDAFKGCSSLKSISIPNSVTTIGDDVFSDCSSLASITIPNSVTSIGKGAFYKCASLTSITIPNSVTSIGDDAFSYCSSLASITIPNSVTSIGQGTFYSCSKLASIAIPNGVTSIGDLAFSGCSSLASITIPGSVISIGNSAFCECPNLTSVTIPNSVTSIGYAAFTDCTGITELHLLLDPSVFTTINMSDIFPTSIKANVYVIDKHYSTYESLFSDFADVTIVKSGIIELSSGFLLHGYSLSLDGCIGVKYYMTLNETALNNNDGAYMKFTVGGKEQKVLAKDLTPDKDGYYIFRCDVAAKEMADEITMQAYLSEGNPVGGKYTYSVKEYAEYIINHPEKYSDSAIKLVKAMLNYGAASQEYFKYNTTNLANSNLIGETQQTTVSYNNLTYRKSGDISPAQVSISLNSTITMKLYFKTTDIKGITFKYNDKDLTPTISGEYSIITIDGILATNFCGRVRINYYTKDSAKLEKLDYWPSNYAYIVLKQSNGASYPTDLKNVVSALYQFSLAAIEYSNSQIQQA